MKLLKNFIFFVTLIIVACSPLGTSSTNSSPRSEVSENTTAYPVNTLSTSPEGYPYPHPTEEDTSHPDKIEIPAPTAGSGVITGKILIQGTNEPYLNSILILGEISTPDQPGYPPLVGYSIESDPRAVQSKDGTFVFDRVKPGKYGIVLWSPLSTFLLADPQTGETIFVSVEDGKVTDLGTIYIK